MKKRTLVIFALSILALGGVTVRIYTLAGRGLETAARQQSTETVTVKTMRGTIYDRDGTPLVNAETETRAAIAPLAETVAALSHQIGSNMTDELEKRMKNGHPTVAVLDALLPPTEGVLQFQTKVRYGERVLAPHAIGYLDGNGQSGVCGAELAFDKHLRSCTGSLSVSYAVDATGAVLPDVQPTITDMTGNAGAGVMLTLQSDIQKAVEDTVLQAGLARGAVLVMSAENAEILALSSFPQYQPTTVADSLASPDSPLLDRTLCNYNCGSVFKMVTAAAALEAGASTDTAYTCSGILDVAGDSLHCGDPLGHGTISMADAFAVSCNPYFVQLAGTVGGEAVYDMAKQCGFSDVLYLSDSRSALKTAAPNLPQKELLKLPRALANFAIGQGDLMASPLHIAALTDAVVNGGMWRAPTLYRGTVNSAGDLTPYERMPSKRAFSGETAAVLEEMMRGVCTRGTGQSAAPFHGGAGGKSGTAETGWLQNGTEVVQSWFTGFFPAYSPQYIVTVLVEDSEQNKMTAGPLFRDICETLYLLSLKQ